MRFVVISDLHLRIPSYSDIESAYKLHYFEDNKGNKKKDVLRAVRDSVVAKQRSCLEDLCDAIIRLGPNFLFITGDIFDKTYFNNSCYYETFDYAEIILKPNNILSDYELRGLFQQFLQKITENCIRVFIVPGNHDLADKEFWSNFFINSFVNIISSNENTISTHRFEAHGTDLLFYLLPYIRNDGSNTENNKDLFEKYLKQYFNTTLYSSDINILFGHQFINICSPFYYNEYFNDRQDTIDVDLLKGFDLVFWVIIIMYLNFFLMMEEYMFLVRQWFMTILLILI